MKSYRSWGYVLILTWLAFSLLPEAGRYWGGMFQEASAPRFRMQQDEAATVSPVLSVYDHGYWGYRCLASPWTVCYGGSQTLVDAALLKVLPRTWVEYGVLEGPPGITWPWLFRYPHVGNVLLWIRVVYAFAILGLFWSLSRSLRFDERGLLLLAIGSSFVFLQSWKGIKNDFPGGFWAVLYFLSYLQCLKSRSSRWLVASVGIGAFSIGVRPATLLAVFVGTAILIGQAWMTRVSIRRFLLVVLKACFAGVFTYLLTNPSFWVSGGELKWLQPIFQVAGRRPSVDQFLRELPIVMASLSPLLISIGFCCRNNERLRRWVLTSLPILAIAAPLLKSSFNNFYYYLPVLLLSWVSFLHFSRESMSSLPYRRILLVLASVISGAQWHFIFNPISAFQSWQQLTPVTTLNTITGVDRATEFVGGDGADLWIDVSLRAPISRQTKDRFKLHYFDSLSESPSLVLPRLGPKASILVSCWKKHLSEDGFLESAPALEWAQWLDDTQCPHRTPLDLQNVRPFFYARQVYNFALVSGERLRVIPDQHHLLRTSQINPRFLLGAIEGAEHWDGPYYFDRNFMLSGELRFDKKVSAITLNVGSSCRHAGGTLELKMNDGHRLPSVSIGLETLNLLVEKYRWIRWLPASLQEWMSHYINRPFPLSPIRISSEVSAGKPILIAISATLPANESCAITLGPVEIRFSD